jgi:hypothetical protein
MLTIIATLIILTAAAFFFPKMRRLQLAHASDLGWMSAQWLAENRASSSKD